jgi:hypothetical protein
MAKIEQPERVTLWAAYAGSAYGSEISLHATEREALEAVVSALGLDFDEDEGETVVLPNGQLETIAGRGRLEDSDNDTLREHLDNYCSTRADDWHVNEVEVELPAQVAAMRAFIADVARCGYSVNRDHVAQITDEARVLLARIDGTNRA